MEVLPSADAQIAQLFGEFPADLGLKNWEVRGKGWMVGWLDAVVLLFEGRDLDDLGLGVLKLPPPHLTDVR